MIRSSNGYEWLLSLSLCAAACHRTHNLNFDTAPLGSAPPRRAPAVADDPAPALPAPSDSAPAASALVVLSGPAGEYPDQRLVEEFFGAVTARDADRLEGLFQAGAKARTSAQATEIDALDFWRSRLSRLDYSKLIGQSIYRRHAVEVYRAEDLQALGNDRSVPVHVGDDQLAVRVPLHSPQSDKTRLFGDEIVFLLSRTERGLLIAEVVEDFQLP
ncbi:MAG TPA: hypothetical protein VI197_06935 [Polyangiaceae bacterium]